MMSEVEQRQKVALFAAVNGVILLAIGDAPWAATWVDFIGYALGALGAAGYWYLEFRNGDPLSRVKAAVSRS